ncbi:hypothetical protein PM082_009347 [Marasmius tenuissimus]|nr:hypothetical protein PM082_009347 [Marasmius tenuissimus]
MENSSYKQLRTSRGYKYNYFASKPQLRNSDETFPVLAFIHGFGIASKDWRHQVAFFQNKGYQIFAPDMLGYGGSAMPTVLKDLKESLVAQDIVEILDVEGIERGIFIGQGGGCPIVSRIAQLYPDRVEACAFLAISYAPPIPRFDLKKVNELQEKQFGYSFFGYWEFLAGDSHAAEIIGEKFKAFFNLNYPDNPAVWITHYGPRGAMRAYLLSDDLLPSPSWFSPEEKKIQYDGIRAMDLSGPFAYYKAYLAGVQDEKSKEVPLSCYTLNLPVFFGAALDDYISLPSIGRDMTTRFCKHEKTRVHDFKASHWLHLQIPEEVNEVLLDWFTSLGGHTDRLDPQSNMEPRLIGSRKRLSNL